MIPQSQVLDMIKVLMRYPISSMATQLRIRPPMRCFTLVIQQIQQNHYNAQFKCYKPQQRATALA